MHAQANQSKRLPVFWLPLLLPFCPVACRRLLDGPSCETVQSVATLGRHQPVKSFLS